MGDAQTLPCANDSFDVALMALVICFLSQPSAGRRGNGSRRAAWRVGRDIHVGHSGGGAPTDPIYISLKSMGMTSVRPANPVVSRREAMKDLWEKAGLESIETQVIRIPVAYSDFDDFWDSNTVLIGPQGKLIAGMSTSEREQFRTDLRERLPTASDGRIVYKSFANAVKGRVPG